MHQQLALMSEKQASQLSGRMDNTVAYSKSEARGLIAIKIYSVIKIFRMLESLQQFQIVEKVYRWKRRKLYSRIKESPKWWVIVERLNLLGVGIIHLSSKINHQLIYYQMHQCIHNRIWIHQTIYRVTKYAKQTCSQSR